MKKVFYICVVLLLVITGCGEKQNKTGDYKNTEQKQTTNETLTEVEKNKKELAKVGGVSLFANKTSDGFDFKEITVQMKDKSETFPWTSSSQYSDYPSLNIADVDEDGKDEIIVILLKGAGTGCLLEEIHVLDIENLSEKIPGVEKPVDAIDKKVKSRITVDNNKVNMVLELDGTKIEKTYNKSEAGVWNESVAFGGIVNYKIHNNKIYAIVPGSVATTWYEVYALVEYDSDLTIKNITVYKNIDGLPEFLR